MNRFLLALTTFWFIWGVDQAVAARPNIVLIMVDDFGYECVTANGGESYRTPNLDRLAAEGIRFEQCHVQPLCTPTRVEMMTGQYNVRNYFRFGILPYGETTFGQLLRKAGYATGICGKWQLGQDAGLPQHFGFDESRLWQQTRIPPRYANPGLEYNGVEKTFHDGEYGPKLVNDFALDFITRHKDQPFFLYYPMILTHNPFQPTPDSPDWDPRAEGERVNRKNKHFADMTTYMDKMVGQVIGKLEELKLRDRTLVIFLGDNGTNRRIVSQFQGQRYPGGKGSTNARGSHVPLICNWPTVIAPGQINDDLIGTTDFLPTICDIAEVPIPSDIDGVSFAPQLRGEKGTPREWLYSWYSPRQRKDLTVSECVFDHSYKLYRDGRFFNLNNDPWEEHPLPMEMRSDAARAEAVKLQQVLDQFQHARPQKLDREFEQLELKFPARKRKKRKS